MAKCSFCGANLEKGTGKMYVFKSGKISYFCTNKCERNQLNLNRKSRKFKWTESYERIPKKENNEK
ncbi:MAG: 50S ribosomal protein L24e [Candidatus Nanoarchaeia archaeon]|nr:50S ribosomal protein L24e [Candidatus Nanoarchaeia archaeon]